MAIFSDTDERIPNVKIGVQLTASAYTAFCYTIMADDHLFQIIKHSSAIYFSFGAFAGIYIFKAGLYFYDLMSAKNKNLTKTGAFLREFFSTFTFVVAILFGISSNAAMGALSSIFFVVSTGVSVLYHFSIFVYAGYQWFFSNDHHKKEIYKISCIKHFINFSLFSVGVILLSCFMFTTIAPLAFGISNAVFNALCFILVAITTIKARHSKKIIDSNEESNIVSENLLPSLSNDYYSCQNRDVQIKREENPKEYLLTEIEKKIHLLESQIKSSVQKFFPQRKKREAKITALNKLKRLILNPFMTNDDFEKLLREPLFHSFFHNPFQSFFKKKSDTWEIVVAARSYFNHFSENRRFNL